MTCFLCTENQNLLIREYKYWTIIIHSNQYYLGSRAPERGLDSNFDGCLDEFRISKVRRSDDWILTSYNNMNDPKGFSNFCTEVTNNKENINLESINIKNDIKKSSRDTETFNPTDDCYIKHNKPDNNNNGEYISVRNEYGAYGGGSAWIAFIKFDISSLPPGATIVISLAFLFIIALLLKNIKQVFVKPER